MATVVLKDVSKFYSDKVRAVNKVSLEVDDKEFMVLVGPSGCGKS
ncbi:MAG: ABC transporter ATP-binding protein, partial [Candidatus Omnitrophica bacterium]|nr:ABC transporter ATP-binding protein [Candidatus Omnitrophota bacterium]